MNQRSLVFVGVFLLVCLLMVNVGCRLQGNCNDPEKQAEFESQFNTGMNQDEVEQKLNELGSTLINDDKVENGDYFLRYRISCEMWGAETYVFRFNPDGKLIILYPLIP